MTWLDLDSEEEEVVVSGPEEGERSFSSGRIRALSAAGGWRRGRVRSDRVVARRRCEQKVQWRVWIGRVGFWREVCCGGGVDIVGV